MRIHGVNARDLPDLWFQAVYDILDNGSRFTIDRGSFAGQTHLEYDYFTGLVSYPGTRPLLPDIPLPAGYPTRWKRLMCSADRGTTGRISSI